MLIYTYLLLIISKISWADDNESTFHPYGHNNYFNLTDDRVIWPHFGRVFDLYTTEYEVRNLLAPITGYNEQILRSTEGQHPPIYFNLLNKDENLGQFVLIDRTLHRINDGRDSVADYPETGPEQSFNNDIDKNVYIGTPHGIYVYNVETQEVEKYGTIDDDILAIDKTNGKDEIYILAADHKIYIVTENGTVKNQVEGINYAKDFVLDQLEAIYFSDEDNKPQVLLKGQTNPHKFEEFDFDIINPILCRPLIGFDDRERKDNSMLYIVDGVAYALINGNQSYPIPVTARVPGLTAFSAEFIFFHFLAADGNIYLDNLTISSPDDADSNDDNVRQSSKKRTSNENKTIAFDLDVETNYEAFKKLYMSKQ